MISGLADAQQPYNISTTSASTIGGYEYSGKTSTLDIYMGYDWFKLCVKYDPTNSTFTLEYYKSARTDEHIQIAKTRRAMYELEETEELQI